jgi:hypothetical protein
MQTGTEEKPAAGLVDVKTIDPSSGEPWPEYLDTAGTVRYMRSRGIKRSAQTLAHQRAAGVGIRWKYLGQKPMATKAEVDRHIDQDMFSDASPLVGRASGRKPGKKLRKGVKIRSASAEARDDADLTAYAKAAKARSERRKGVNK